MTPVSEETLREALRLNDEDVWVLTRLDQQLIYFPVIAVATDHKGRVAMGNGNLHAKAELAQMPFAEPPTG